LITIKRSGKTHNIKAAMKIKKNYFQIGDYNNRGQQKPTEDKKFY